MRRPLLVLCGALLLAALAACGSGLRPANRSVGPSSSLVLGTVTGYGATVLDGHAFAGPPPHAFNDDDPGAALPADAVRLGQRLEWIDEGAAGGAALVAAAVVGRLQAVAPDGRSFVIDGLQIRVNTDPERAPVTFYSGLKGFAALRPGSMVLRVDGPFAVDAQGQPYILATRIEPLPTTTRHVRLIGVVSGLEQAAGSFHLGAVRVRTDATTQVYPAGTALHDGELVNVWSPRPLQGHVLHATVVRVRSLLGASGAVRIGGLLSRGIGGMPHVAGIAITATNARAAARLRALRDGAYVVVRGRAVAADRVLARSIRPYRGGAAPVQLRGTVSDYRADGHFRVRSVPVDASALLAGERLRDGSFVQLAGRVDPAAPDTVLALRLRSMPMAPRGALVDLHGRVSQYDPSRGTLVLRWDDSGVTTACMVTLASDAVFGGLRSAQLHDGSRVRIEAMQTGHGLLAYSVSRATSPTEAGRRP